jgi:hypothetical protein
MKIKIIITFLLFTYAVYPQTSNWISIGANDNTLTRLHFNSSGDTLYIGTIEGYRFYSLYSSQWVNKDMTGWIGRTVWALSSIPGRYARVITGRVNAFFKGYIELNDNFSLQGTIVRNSQGGKFMDIKYCPNNPDTVFACGFSDITPGDLVKSTNGGANWTLLSAYLHTAMTEIAINPVNNNIIFVSGDGKITKSTNYGDIWTSSYNGLPSNLGCYTVTINPFNPQILLTSNDNGIYRSSDGGDNWTQVHSTPCRRVTFHPNYQNISAAVSFSPYKVLLSTDNGINWADSTGTLIGTNLIDLAFSKHDNNLYVASATSGVYKRLFVITGISKVNEVVPDKFSLEQNYPNPFNQFTMFNVQCPIAGIIQVKVYDLVGREVATLVDDRLEAGTYEVKFDAGNLTSGIYFYQLKSEKFSETKKLILIK